MKTLGILLNNLDDDLARTLVRGLDTKAEEYGLRLVYFPGRFLHAPQLVDRQFNLIYDLAFRLPLDGVLVVTHAIQSGAYDDEVDQVLALFQPTPLLSLNFVARDNPSVILDNHSGCAQLYQHLLHCHGYRRIAYMRGTFNHFDEEERFDAYLDCLGQAGIAYDPRLIVQGNFDAEGGRRAMEELLARQVQFDVLVAANDQMALAALAVANEQKFHVPGDFAICGFDNFRSAVSEAPPLTTIDQPLELQAQMALELLLSHINGRPIPLITRVPLRLVVRQSCGCIGGHNGTVAVELPRGPLQYREKIWAALNLPGERQPVYKSYLLFLEHCLRQVEKNAWMDASIGEFAQECLLQEGDVSQLQSLVFYLQHYLADICASVNHLPSPEFMQACAEQMQKWQIVIANKLRQFQLHKRLEEQSRHYYLTHYVKAPVSDFTLENIAESLHKTLTHLRIQDALLGLYLQGFDYQLFGVDVPAQLRPLLSLRAGKLLMPEAGQLLALEQMLAGENMRLKPEQKLVFLPIFQHSHHYGLALLDISDNPDAPLEWLRQEIVSLVVNAKLTEELNRKQRHLEISHNRNARLVQIAERDELTGLLNRRGFFHRAPLWLRNSYGGEALMLFVDLDDFKRINDSYGHSEGDAALVVAARLITSVFRREDLVCRLGGDEFVVMSAGFAPERVNLLRERLQEVFARFNLEGQKDYSLSCSLGFYPFVSDDARALEDIMRCADEMLYAEKRRRKQERLN